MFKVGDYVTGVDRSYKRSLYQVTEIDEHGNLMVRFIALGTQYGRLDDVMPRSSKEFRHIEPGEYDVEMAKGRTSILISFVRRLIKKSYRARR